MLFALLSKITHYYDNGLYAFSSNTQSALELIPIDQNQSKSLLLIACRRYYTELSRSYPIENRSEVKKLVKLEYQGQKVFYKIAKVDNGKTQVNIWVFSAQLPQAFLTLPESLLFSTLLTNNDILKVNGQHSPLFVAKHNEVVSSQLAGALITNPQSFAMAIGLPGNAKVNELTPEARVSALLTSLKALSIADLSLFFTLPPVKPTSHTIKTALLPSVVLFVMYMFGSSAYLLVYKAYLQSQIEQQTDGINTALDISANMEAQLARYTVTRKFMSKQKDVAAVWLVMVELFPEAEFSRFQLEQGRFVLAGQVERATTLLEQLNAHPFVKEARFDNPTRNSRGKEYFVISFTVKSLKSSGDEMQGESDA